MPVGKNVTACVTNSYCDCMADLLAPSTSSTPSLLRLRSISILCRVPQATIAGGGVIPHIHKSLISKTGKKEVRTILQLQQLACSDSLLCRAVSIFCKA